MGVYFDRRVRACYRANATPDAPGTLDQLGVEIPLKADLFGHRQDLLRAGPDAQLTAFTMILVYRNTGHYCVPYMLGILTADFLVFPWLEQGADQRKHRDIDKFWIYSFQHLLSRAGEYHGQFRRGRDFF